MGRTKLLKSLGTRKPPTPIPVPRMNRYTDCCQVAGVPELAHLFCAVDRPFFQGLSHLLEFSCPERLADGGRACTFCFAEA